MGHHGLIPNSENEHRALKPILISPPFGSRLPKFDWATSVCGSYTVHPRPGLWGQVARTLRPVRGGWINQIGLRNVGIRNIKFDADNIYSLCALEEDDYGVFYDVVPEDVPIEINLGCPNTEKLPPITDLSPFVDKHPLVIVKLPPHNIARVWMSRCYKMGVRYFHLCNTLPTKDGGVSGEQLKFWSLRYIDHAVKHYKPFIKIIAGGGIYSPEDVQLYKDAGADYYSLSTAWFTPWKIPAIKKAIDR